VPTVVVASSLARWLTPTPTIGAGERTLTVAGPTLRDVLDRVFAEFPQLRGYVVDERGAMRHHIVAFVNGTAVRDKDALSDAVEPGSEVHLFQALSGG
jgi:molybdopterin converting factor small subunit